MTLNDALRFSLGNLWRMKLRSFLTISGVVIGIAALVSMLSFGAGMQKNVAEQFKSFELFTSLMVIPQMEKGENAVPDSIPAKILNDSAITEIKRIPGVKSVIAEDTFPLKIEFAGKTVNTRAQALPAEMSEISAFQNLLAGRFFQNDSASEAVISQNLMRELGVEKPDSIIGKEITIISAKLDLQSAVRGFFSGKRTIPFSEVTLKLRVCGVRKLIMGDMGITLRDIIIPSATARSFEHLNFSNPFELLSQIRGEKSEAYSLLTVRMNSSDVFQSARDSIEALGYNTFSFADQFEQVRKVFLVFDAVLGVVGFIALVVASLGIVNTMVMSIMERYREIGIMKSLGADNRHIKLFFLVESGVIGLLGAAIGIVFGWMITRIGSAFAKYMMVKEGGPEIELFDLPLWLIILALMFGLVVSLMAGLYPSIRASRVDPVKALRHD